MTGTHTVSRELPILCGPGIARIPFPMTEDDFELLIATLNLWKKKLTQESITIKEQP